MKAYEASVERTRRILTRQFELQMVTRAWELDLARLLDVEVPDAPLDDLRHFWRTTTRETPFPDGPGPWGAHPAWGEESYGIGNTRTFARILVDGGVGVPNPTVTADWIAGLQRADGGFACQAEFERLYRQRHPGTTRAFPHSDLEDAWSAIDALAAMGGSVRDPAGAVGWIQRMQRADGAFQAAGSYAGELSETLHALWALAALSAPPAKQDRCLLWLLGILPQGIVPTWATAESLAVVGGLRMWVGDELMTRWEQVEFSQNAAAPMVSLEAYAAVKVQQRIDEVVADD